MDIPAVREACVSPFRIPSGRNSPCRGCFARRPQRNARRAATISFRELRQWQLPDAIVFVEAIPRTCVGKFQEN